MMGRSRPQVKHIGAELGLDCSAEQP